MYISTDACVEMLPNLEPFVGADTRLNRAFGLHWNLDKEEVCAISHGMGYEEKSSAGEHMSGGM